VFENPKSGAGTPELEGARDLAAGDLAPHAALVKIE
jgi:hypothetical protein